jgi:hypothetical protein
MRGNLPPFHIRLAWRLFKHQQPIYVDSTRLKFFTLPAGQAHGLNAACQYIKLLRLKHPPLMAFEGVKKVELGLKTHALQVPINLIKSEAPYLCIVSNRSIPCTTTEL